MKRIRTAAIVASALSAVVAASTAPASPVVVGGSQVENEPARQCRAVLETLSRGDIYPSSQPRTNVGFRLRCPYEIRQISFRTSKPLERVYERPRLEGPDPGDSLTCRKSSSETLGVCDGTVGEDVRILGALKVKGGPCGRNPLRATFRLQGGIDCEPGEVCSDIGYSVRVRVEEPRGC